MSKRRHQEELEIPFVALMDTMTNVVGVLIIVLVLVGLGVSSAVKKILSDLPSVDEKTVEMLKITMEKEGIPPDPALLDQKATETEKQINKLMDDIKSLDISDAKQNVANVADIGKQLEDRKKERDAKKLEIEKLLAEVEAMKLRLDQTPVFKPAPGTIVKIPDPRPYPEKPVETRVLVAKEGVIMYQEAEYLGPILAGLEKGRSQLRYGDVQIAPFAPMLEKVFGTKAAAQAAWPEIAPLAKTFQLDLVAQAFQILSAGGAAPNKAMIERLGDISVKVRKPMPAVAAAVVAATKGDLTKWVAMDPAVPPAVPIIKATLLDGKITFTWRSFVEEVRANPRDVLAYFKTLSELDEFKDANADRVIYDAFRIVDMLKKAASNTAFTKAFEMTPEIRPGSTAVRLTLKPRPGAGETVQQLPLPTSKYVLALRNIKSDPNGVAVFQILPDAIPTYLEARRIAEEVGVSATWGFIPSLELAANIPGFEVQRFTVVTPPRAPTTPGVRIAPPKKTVE